jgi:hypothetical protein
MLTSILTENRQLKTLKTTFIFSKDTDAKQVHKSADSSFGYKTHIAMTHWLQPW